MSEGHCVFLTERGSGSMRFSAWERTGTETAGTLSERIIAASLAAFYNPDHRSWPHAANSQQTNIRWSSGCDCLHALEPRCQPGRPIWRHWVAGPPSGSPWLLCWAVSWPGRRRASRPRPGRYLGSCWPWLPLAGPARPPFLSSVAETHIIMKTGSYVQRR